MSAPKNKSEGAEIFHSIQEYGFAAAIEVSNHLKRRTKKSGQARQTKKYLEEMVGAEPEISAGVAFNGNFKWVPYTEGIDFIIEINTYDPVVLNKVAEDMLYSRYLSSNQKDFLRIILENRDKEFPTTTFFLRERVEDCAERIGKTTEFYQNNIGNISGLCVEIYVKTCLEDQIPNAEIRHRHNFTYTAKDYGSGVCCDADNIVICQKEEFYMALRRMDKKQEFTTWLLQPNIE